MYCGEEVVDVVDVGREKLGKRFEMAVKEGGGSFDGGYNTGNDRSALITRYMDFGK